MSELKIMTKEHYNIIESAIQKALSLKNNKRQFKISAFTDELQNYERCMKVLVQYFEEKYNVKITMVKKEYSDLTGFNEFGNEYTYQIVLGIDEKKAYSWWLNLAKQMNKESHDHIPLEDDLDAFNSVTSLLKSSNFTKMENIYKLRALISLMENLDLISQKVKTERYF